MFSFICDDSVLHMGEPLNGGHPFLSWNRNFPNKEIRLLHSPVRSRLKWSNSRQNQHVGYFPTVGSATIRNLIGLPLLQSYYV